jgi:hypothetical protein
VRIGEEVAMHRHLASCLFHVSVVVFVAGLAVAAPAAAQEPPVSRHGHDQAITANPFLLVIGWVNVEYERRINSSSTWGVSGSIFDLDDFGYRSAKVLYRYYPQQDALSGLFVGGRTGAYHLEDRVGGGLTGRVDDDSETFLAVGVEMGYVWLLGRDRKFAISLGGGLSRLFGGDLEGAPITIPTVRLINIGIAF